MHSFLTPWSTLSLFLDQWGESGLSSVSHCPNPEERGAGVPGVRAGSLGLGRVPGVWAGSDLDTCAPRSRWPSQAPVAVSSCSKSRGGGAPAGSAAHLGAMAVPLHVRVPGPAQGPAQTPAAPGVGSARREAPGCLSITPTRPCCPDRSLRPSKASCLPLVNPGRNPGVVMDRDRPGPVCTPWLTGPAGWWEP